MSFPSKNFKDGCGVKKKIIKSLLYSSINTPEQIQEKDIHWFTRKHFGVSSARNSWSKKKQKVFKWIAILRFLFDDPCRHPDGKLKKQKEFTRHISLQSLVKFFNAKQLWVKDYKFTMLIYQKNITKNQVIFLSHH